MAGIVGFLFRYKNEWSDNINELLDADRFIKEVTKNVEDSKLYAQTDGHLYDTTLIYEM